ncbi:pyrimidine reductase family protein [Streptomyces sp. NPDC048845]|uniref:pyrimidine reductase family protein n=1 Tax=Streptomyces sp. NPDC048845 TaxID=3155390 RepID=UPI00343B7767
MRRLFPLTAESASPDQLVDHEWGLDELADAYAYPEAAAPPGEPAGADGAPAAAGGPAEDAERPGRAWLRANMVSSVDGASWHDGRSHPLSSDADMRIFGVLRGLADVVVAGAETVRKEGYRPARARDAFAARRAELGQTPAPAIAVVSASLDLDYGLPLFTDPVTPTLVLTGAAAVAERPERVERARAAGAEVVIAGHAEGVEPELVLGVLADRGLRRVLTEGGPRLLGQFAAAGVLDELCCTLAPVVAAGEAPRIVDGPRIAVPKRFSLVSVLEEEGFLFTRYRREPAGRGASGGPDRDDAAPDI